MTPTEKKDGFARSFAEIRKLDYSEDFVLVFPDGPPDEDGERPIMITNNPLKDCVQMDADTINAAFSSRARPLVEALEVFAKEAEEWERHTPDSERLYGRLRGYTGSQGSIDQMEGTRITLGHLRAARKVLEEFRGK